MAVDEARKAIFAGSSLKAFDFLVYRDDGPNHLVLVVHGRPTAEQDELLAEWEKVFGPAFMGVYTHRRADTWIHLPRGGAVWTEYLPENPQPQQA